MAHSESICSETEENTRFVPCRVILFGDRAVSTELNDICILRVFLARSSLLQAWSCLSKIGHPMLSSSALSIRPLISSPEQILHITSVKAVIKCGYLLVTRWGSLVIV
jgi:hypothetical protein